MIEPAWMNPDGTRLPCPKNADIVMTTRTFGRAITLFSQVDKDERVVHTHYKAWLCEKEKVTRFLVGKPPYTPAASYMVDTEAGTCTCPWFAGVPARDVRRGTNPDLTPIMVPMPAEAGHGYCKHLWAVLLAIQELSEDPEVGLARLNSLLPNHRLDKILRSWRQRVADRPAPADESGLSEEKKA